MLSSSSLLSVVFLAALVAPPKFAVPNFSDLTIKTRRTLGDQFSTVETLYLKGARQRSEHVGLKPTSAVTDFFTIQQCDKRRIFNFSPSNRTYASFPIEDWSERAKRARLVPQPSREGSDVNISVNSEDTGERKQLGSFTARRVKTTTRVEPAPGAVTPASVEEVDGWYIDLAGLGCTDNGNSAAVLLSVNSGDRLRFKNVLAVRRGYPIEETRIKTEAGRTTTTKVELLEFSEAPVADMLFDVPPGYAPALRTGNGGYDFTRPDTLANRVSYRWSRLVASARRLIP